MKQYEQWGENRSEVAVESQWLPKAGGHCVLKWILPWTFPRNQDATEKLKSELISIKF